MRTAHKAKREARPGSGYVDEAYLHILAREHNTESLARALGVSFATATRVIEELRAKIVSEGGDVVSVKTSKGWHYEIREEIDWRNDPLMKVIGTVKGSKPQWKNEDDEIIYGRD